MPTTYTDQFWIMDPYAPPPVGTVLTVSDFDIIDQNDNDLINRFNNDSIDGSDIRASFLGDTVTVTLSDNSTVTITGVTFYLADGREVFTPTDGSVLSDATLVSTSFVTNQTSIPPAVLEPTCFTVGTLISTAIGETKVEDLIAGDLVVTADKGLATVVLVHKKTMSPEHLYRNPNHRPVEICSGSLGQGLPLRDLIVSPQHRVLISSNIADRMFGTREILVPACQLVGQSKISRLETDKSVHYVHILLDHHAVVFAEGAPSESLYLGKRVYENLTPGEIEHIRSKLSLDEGYVMQPARQFVRGKRLKRLLERHVTNDKPLLDTQYGGETQQFKKFA